MVSFIFPSVEQIRIITAQQLPWKTGLCKLIKEAIPLVPSMVAADLDAVEADFSGYAAVTETTLPVPYADPQRGGFSFQIPTIQFNTANPTTVGNDIYGGWFEDSGGLLLMAFVLSNPVEMQTPNAALVLDILVNMFGTNQVYVNINDIVQ